MKTIRIYNEDAEVLNARATELGITPSDLAGMIFRDHFAGSGESGFNKSASDPEPPGNPRHHPVASKGPLLTPKELADHFKTTASTVLSWYHDGTIPAEVAVGKVYRFDLDRVSATLAYGASLPVVKAREQAEREARMRVDVVALMAETDRDRKAKRRGNGDSTPGPMVPTY